MFAVVKIKNQQYRVEPDLALLVPKLEEEVGATVTIPDVLMLADGDDIKVGDPTLVDCSVAAEVVRHGLSRKIVVFKKKRRKNYRRKNGHRQPFTEIRIKAINA